jgi:hypothetical protein
MTGPVTPEDLVEIEAIKQLKYRYARCLDQKLWDQMGDLLTEDAVAEYSAGKYRHEGRDAIVGWISESMASEGFLSSHRMHHPEIRLTGPDTAEGTWALEDTVVHTDYDLTIQGAAFYEDRYRKEDDGQWRIEHTGYKRTYEEIFPRASIEGLRLTASWWGTGGASELEA